MCDLAVDVGVLITASAKGSDRSLIDVTRRCLDAIRGSHCRLILDTEDLIAHQIKDKMDVGDVGFEWVKQMIIVGRVVRLKRIRVSSSKMEALSRRGFSIHNEDYRLYVRTVAASVTRVLVSLDLDFLGNRLPLRKSFGISVYSPEEFVDLPSHR